MMANNGPVVSCSIIVFAVRAIVQFIFFTPKAPPFDPTRNQPFIGAIFASNLFCMAYHKFLSHPEADETTRGYLHGGLLIDFIGQKAPVSLVRLLSLDVLVLLLDLIMLGLIIERVKTIDATAANSAASEPIETSPDPQDHDSEERGVLRTGPLSPSASPQQPPTTEDIELNELRPRNSTPHSDSSTDEQLERTELLAEPAGGKHTHPLDVFSSGEAVVMNMGLLDIIRDQWRYSPAAMRRPSPYVPSDQTATFLRERFGLQVGPDGRVQRIGS